MNTDQARSSIAQFLLAENERKLAAAREEFDRIKVKLLTESKRIVEQALWAYASSAPINATKPRPEAILGVQSYLLSARAIPIHPKVSEMLEMVGFDSSHFTAGEFQGEPVMFAPGIPLLKFVGYVKEDCPSIDEMEALLSRRSEDPIH